VTDTSSDAAAAPADGDIHEFTLPADPMLTQRFAMAITDEDPIYFDDEAARAAGYERKVAPVTFVSSILEYQAGPPESELKEDGVGTGLFPSVVRPDALLMGGGQDIDFWEPIYQGDDIHLRRDVVDVYQRPSKRFGELTFVVMQTDGHNQDGVKVVTIRDTLIVKQ
jgi:acyl dehydratase